MWGTRVHLPEAGDILQSGCGYMRVSSCAPLPLMEQFSSFPSGIGTSSELAATANGQIASVNNTGNATVGAGSSRLSQDDVVSLAVEERLVISAASGKNPWVSERSNVTDVLDQSSPVETSVSSQQAAGTSLYAGVGDVVVMEPGSGTAGEFRQPPFVAPNITGLEPDSFYAGGLLEACDCYRLLFLLSCFCDTELSVHVIKQYVCARFECRSGLYVLGSSMYSPLKTI